MTQPREFFPVLSFTHIGIHFFCFCSCVSSNLLQQWFDVFISTYFFALCMHKNILYVFYYYLGIKVKALLNYNFFKTIFFFQNVKILNSKIISYFFWCKSSVPRNKNVPIFPFILNCTQNNFFSDVFHDHDIAQFLSCFDFWR